MAQTSAVSSPTAVYAHLVAADRESPLEPEDLARLATAAYLIGREAESAGFWGRAHHGFHDRNQPAAAARSAFWLAYALLDKGESAQASGWLARARRLLDECGQDCVERGYLLLPEALRSISEGDYERAFGTFRLAAESGERFGDADLVALARHGEGRVLIRLGRTAAGPGAARRGDGGGHRRRSVAPRGGRCVLRRDLRLPGGVRLAPGAGVDRGAGQVVRRASPIWCPTAGSACCVAPRCCSCEATGAPRWTRRAEPASGSPIRQARRGSARRSTSSRSSIGCVASFAEAEEAYRQASLHGRRPQPGLALLRLAQGEVAAALTAIAGAVDESAERRIRSRLLAGPGRDRARRRRHRSARTAAEELAAIAAELGAPYLRAASGQAAGASASPRAMRERALAALREAEADLAGPGGAVRGGAHAGADRPSPAARWATRARRSWSSRRRALASSGSAPRTTWRGWSGSAGRRRARRARAGSRRGSCKSSGWSRPARPTALSPPSSGSARRRWPAT